MSLKKKISPEKMAEMVNPPNSMPLSKIGSMYNVSRQRVHQVLKEYRQLEPNLFIKPKDPSKEEIQDLLDKNISLTAIANQFNVSVNKIRKLMEKYSLKRINIKDKLNKEILYSHFVLEGKTDKEIAELYNCSRNTVMKLRYANGIKRDMRELKQKVNF
jgi:uncharacterized protein YjcR